LIEDAAEKFAVWCRLGLSLCRSGLISGAKHGLYAETNMPLVKRLECTHVHLIKLHHVFDQRPNSCEVESRRTLSWGR
jgi:hypothetical protein